ncbi:MAG: YezD family protein [Planctomycetaceae bacterium]
MLELETAATTDRDNSLVAIPRDLLVLIRHALHGMQFGNVTLVVHDGHVVQLDRVEHTRHKRTGRSH